MSHTETLDTPAIDTQSIANNIEAALALEAAVAPEKHPLTRGEMNDVVQHLATTRSTIADLHAAMERKIAKIRERYEPQLNELYTEQAILEQEVSDRIKARGGRGARTDGFIVRIEQESGKLVKNVPLLRKLVTLLTPDEYASVYKQTPKTGFTEDFDARKLAELRDFYGDKHEIGELIAKGMYHAPTPAAIVIEPVQNAVQAA